jgi:hypothetical protein
MLLIGLVDPGLQEMAMHLAKLLGCRGEMKG